MCQGKTKEEAMLAVREWWISLFKTFTGYISECKHVASFAVSFRSFAEETDNHKIVDFYEALTNDFRYKLACITLFKSYTVDKIIKVALSGNLYANRFLVDHYRDRDRLAHVSHARAVLHVCPYDAKARQVIALAWFSGCGSTHQSYDEAIKYGMPYDLCISHYDEKNQLPIVLRVLIDRPVAIISSTRFILGLRLVCKSWDKVILACSNFWKRLYVPTEHDNVTNGELGRLVIERKMHHAREQDLAYISSQEMKIAAEMSIVQHKQFGRMNLMYANSTDRMRAEANICKYNELTKMTRLLEMQKEEVERKYKRQKKFE